MMIEITKYRWSSLWESVHLKIWEINYYYKYDNSDICCTNMELKTVQNWVYKTIRSDWYCSYNQTNEEKQEIMDKRPQLVKDIMEYLKTYNWEEIW